MKNGNSKLLLFAISLSSCFAATNFSTFCSNVTLDGSVEIGCHPGDCPSNTLTVCAPTSFNENVTISCPNTLNVCDENVNGTLTVNGIATVNGPLTVAGASGSLGVSNNGSFGGNLIFNTGGVPLLAVGSNGEILPLRILRGAVDTTSGSPMAGGQFGFTPSLVVPGEVDIVFDTPFSPFSRPAVVITAEDYSDLAIAGLVKINSITEFGFTLRTYRSSTDTLQGTVANFIVIGPA
jgi:hypothetical protein